jgi:hypothetical protein
MQKARHWVTQQAICLFATLSHPFTLLLRIQLQVTQGLGDLVGKLLPVWEPARPQATMAGIATARMLLVPAMILGLYFDAGPEFFFPMVFILLVSAW